MRRLAVIFISILPVFCFVHLNIKRSHEHKQLEKRTIRGVEIPLENSLSLYQTELLVGTPPQAVLVQVDTGSSDLWLISAANPFCRTLTGICSMQSTFDPEKSVTLKTNQSSIFAIAYGDSTFASGTYVQDDIEIGGVSFIEYSDHRYEKSNDNSVSRGEWVQNDTTPLMENSNSDENTRRLSKDDKDVEDPKISNDMNKSHRSPSRSTSGKLIIRNANFALAERVNSSEAIMGIGLDTTESMARHINSNGKLYPTYANLPLQMKEQGYIETVAYSLWLNDLYASSGSLLFGAVDHSKYKGQLQIVPLVSIYQDIAHPIDFSIMLHGLTVYNNADESVDIVKCSAPVLLDSGTTYSRLPAQLIDPLARSIGCIYDPQENVYLVTETQKQRLKGGGIRFNFSGIEIDVNLDEILIPIGPLEKKKFSKVQSEKNLNFDDIVLNHETFSGNEIDTSLIRDIETSDDDSTYSFLDDASMIKHKRNENYYVLAIFPMKSSSNSASYILGDSFLRSAYVVYDLEHKEIAMANTCYNSTSSHIDVIGPQGIPNATKALAYDSTAISSEVIVRAGGQLFGVLSRESTETESSHTQTIDGILSRTAIITASNGYNQSTVQNHHSSYRGHHKNDAMKIRGVPLPLALTILVFAYCIL